ncbi:hypothetical protein Tco_0459950 [Tanacetum coccineum]
MVKNKRLVAEAYEWDEEDVSSNDNDITEVKVLMALVDDENVVVGKESARNAEDIKVSIPGVERPWLSQAEGFTLLNHDSATEYDSAHESLVCSTPLPLLDKLDGVEPVSGPKTIKSILK